MPENTSNSTDFKSRYPDSTECDANLAVKFLTQIAKGGRVVVVAVPVNSKASPRTWAYDMADPNEVEELRSFMRYNETQPHNMFYAPNRTAVWKTPTPPDNNDIDQIRHIVLDFDPNKEATARGEIESERMRLRTVAYGLLNGPVQPRTIVNTGGGMQVVFELEPPFDIPVDEPYEARKAKREMIEALMRDLSRALGAETHTCTAKNLFRIPGTKNWPTAAKKKAGREISIGGLWFTGGPRTTLDELRSLTLREGGPVEASASASPGVDLGDIDENALIEVLAKPDKLPQRLKALVATNNALAEAVKHPIKPDDTSAYDHHLCKTMVSLSIPAGDMALILVAYSEKAKTTHYQQNRLFSYIRTTIGKAISEDPVNLLDPANFDEALAAAERAQREQAQAERTAKFRFLSYDEAIAGIFDEDEGAVIQGLLRRKEMAVFYGMTGSGKTFASVDIACRISLGMEWCGRATTKLRVAYIAAEAGGSIKRRLAAWGKVHGQKPDVHVLAFGPDLFHAPSATEGQMTDMNRLFGAADAIMPNVFFIDTLARTMIGGNENSTADMNALIANGDRLRDRYAANVVWVHHTGKDEGLGARGSSALKSATDLEVVVKNNSDPRHFSVTKLRDGDPFGYEFELSKIVIGTMAKSGEVVETCTVTWGGRIRGGDDNVQRQSARDFVRQILELIGEPSTIGDIMAAADADGIRKPNKNSVQSTLDRGCKGEEPLFKLHGTKQISKNKTANLYGLIEW